MRFEFRSLTCTALEYVNEEINRIYEFQEKISHSTSQNGENGYNFKVLQCTDPPYMTIWLITSANLI